MKGIIIASFGSIYKEAVETSIGTIESKVRSLYRDVEVRRVFLPQGNWWGIYSADYSRSGSMLSTNA